MKKKQNNNNNRNKGVQVGVLNKNYTTGKAMFHFK